MGANRSEHDAYRHAMQRYRQGRFEEAIACFKQVKDAGEVEHRVARFYQAQAHRALAMAKIRAGRDAEAVEQLRQAAAINPGDADLGCFLSLCRAKTAKSSDLAAQLLQFNLAQYPAHTPSRIRSALATYRAGRTVAAVATLQAGIKRDPNQPLYYYYLGLLYAERESFDDAADMLQRAIQQNREMVDAHLHLGLVRAAQGAYEPALESLREAHRRRPFNNTVALYFTLALVSTGRRAMPEFGSPAAPTRPQLAGRDAGWQQLTEAIAAEPEFVEALLGLPPCLMDQQIYAAVVDILRAAVRAHPKYADLHLHLSRAYARLGDVARAIKASKRALRINPRYVSALVHLARLYAETNQQDAAIERLKAAIAAGGDYPDVHYLLGKLYQNQGHNEQARHSYERALALNGEYGQAREALERLAA